MAVDRQLLCPDPADRSLRGAVAAISQLVAGGRYSSQRGNRAHLARPLGTRWTRGGTPGPSSLGHPPLLHRNVTCPLVLSRPARDPPLPLPYRFPIPPAR